MPRVKIIDGIRRKATPNPLASPKTRPQRTPKGSAIAAPVSPHQPDAPVAIMPPTVTTQGIDRSMWPSRMTSMTPDAMMPRNDATWSCCSR